MSASSEAAEEAAARIDLAVKVLGLAYTLMCLAWLAWAMIPEHRRKLLMMRLAEATRRSASRTASRAGHQAMGLEISGCGANYSFPYVLSLTRDKAAAALERLRYS